MFYSKGAGASPPVRSTFGARLTVVLLLLMQQGCGSGDPNLIDVSGTVTLDGKPLPDAQVRFIPEVQGTEQLRPTIGVTDQSGAYTLEFSTNQHGILPGKYRVAINTGRVAEDGRKGVRIPGAPETVPNVYNAKTTLTADVSPDKRTFNFDLKSDSGQVVQPGGGT